MVSSPITSWHKDEKTMETVTDFIFLGSKITAGGDCSHEIKRLLLFGRKAMTNLESILKSRDVTLLTKIHIVKAIVFPVVMYGYESWTIKNSECWRTDAFELWYWRRLLRVSWTGRKSNQSVLKEINPEYSLKGLMLKRKLQYFGHLMWRADSLENTLIWGKTEGRRRRGNKGQRWWMASPIQWTWTWVNPGRWWRIGKHATVYRSQSFWHYWATEQQHMLSTNSTVLPLLFQFGYFVFFLLSDCCGEFFQYYLEYNW